jgi:uncharacterized DUF497 family protein
MEFEYDPEKSAANAEKHGINFEEAKALWNDDRLLEARAAVADEPRFLVIGMIDRRHWIAVCTYRESRIRIISVRRARKREIEYYEGV